MARKLHPTNNPISDWRCKLRINLNNPFFFWKTRKIRIKYTLIGQQQRCNLKIVTGGNVLSKALHIGLAATVLIAMMLTGSGLVMSVSASPIMGRGSRHCDDLFAGHWTFGWDFTFGTILSIINTALAAVLLTAYIGIYRRTRAPFNLVLIIVALTLLCYSLVANPLVGAVLGYEASGLGIFFILPDLFALAALSALLYLSLRY